MSEAANYDFGIGEPEDLFEALIIYTRVLSGYYDSVYKYNLSAAELNRIKARWAAQPWSLYTELFFSMSDHFLLFGSSIRLNPIDL